MVSVFLLTCVISVFVVVLVVVTIFSNSSTIPSETYVDSAEEISLLPGRDDALVELDVSLKVFFPV